MKLSSTSALVLLWAGRQHLNSTQAQEYLNHLDLDEGRPLYTACNEICPYYAEVIRNRKHGVRTFITEAIQQGSADQIVIAGAGLDPVGIDLAETHPNLRVFEIDRENMQIKQQLRNKNGKSHHNPVFIDADLADAKQVQQALLTQGWDPDADTTLVFEGISYYLQPESLQQLSHSLHPKRIICEYLKPEPQITPERARIPEQVFGLIARECVLPTIHRHDIDSLQNLFQGMRLAKRCGMVTLERARTGTNQYFPTEESGWIEVSLFQ